MAKQLTRDTILGAKLEVEEVTIEEWGGKVFVRGLTAAERGEVEQRLLAEGKDKVQLKELRPDLATKCIVDKEGARLFEDSDAGAIGNLSGKAIEKVVMTALRLSGMTAEDMETLKKN